MRPARLFAALTMLFALSTPPALACGEPSLEWYQQKSDAVIDGVARCNSEKRSCKVRISRVVKRGAYTLERGRTLDLDFVEFQFIESSDKRIAYSCGSPLFEPEFSRFTGRFYLDVDKFSGEATVRRHRIRTDDGKLWRESYCVENNGTFKCKYQ